MPKADVVFVAYSFDQPSVVEALEAHRGKVRLLADVSQTNGRTKQQYQVLLRLQRSGCNVRVGTGTSVRDAYSADGRDIASMPWVPRSKVLSMARVVWWSKDATLFA